MGNVSRGKPFEQIIRESFECVEDTSVIRLPDPVQGYLGYRNICDFIVYHKPYQYFLECKTVHGNTLPIHSIPKPDKRGKLHGFYGNITDTQWEGMLEMSYINGVIAGVICWWVDKDVTKFIPIQILNDEYEHGKKSVRFDSDLGLGWQEGGKHFISVLELTGRKKRVFYEYDMARFFEEVSR